MTVPVDARMGSMIRLLPGDEERYLDEWFMLEADELGDKTT